MDLKKVKAFFFNRHSAQWANYPSPSLACPAPIRPLFVYRKGKKTGLQYFHLQGCYELPEGDKVTIAKEEISPDGEYLKDPYAQNPKFKIGQKYLCRPGCRGAVIEVSILAVSSSGRYIKISDGVKESWWRIADLDMIEKLEEAQG